MNAPLSGGWRHRHWRVQTGLAVGALAAAVSLPVILLSVGGGVSSHALDELRGSGYQITVSAPGLHGMADAHRLAQQIAATPRVAFASVVLSEALDLQKGGGGVVPLLVEGVLPGAFPATLAPAEAALFPNPLPLGDPTDLAHWANGSYSGPSAGRIVLSGPVAGALGIGVGSTVALAPSSNASAAERFTVSGTFGVSSALIGPTGAFAALLPLSDLQLLAGVALGPNGTLIDGADSVQVALGGAAATDPNAVDAVASVLQAEFPYYAVGTLAQSVAQAESAASILNGFYLALSSVSLSVGWLFLALVLVRRVESIRPALAIRRAIGVPARLIARDLALEAGLLALAGAVGGLLLGAAAIAALGMWGNPTLRATVALTVYDPVVLGELTAAVVLLGLLASSLATRSALRLPVTEVLR